MKTKVTDMLGVEFPILAFSHCRDVVAAVTRAGGFGVLGAVAHTPEQLEVDLGWIEEQTHGGRYGVDLLLPANYAGVERGRARRRGRAPAAAPGRSRSSSTTSCVATRCPSFPPTCTPGRAATSWPTWPPKGYEPLLDVAFAHDIALVASALGPPPPALITRAHDAGVVVAALAGTAPTPSATRAAGVDVIVAQGTEAGGHTGEVGTMVLVPEVVDAVAPDARARRRRHRPRTSDRGGVGARGATACGAGRCGSPPRRPRPNPWSSRSFSTPRLATPCDPGH